MVRDTVGLALAGVLAGLAAMLFVASIAVQPFLVVAAIPFAAGAYLVWQASIGEYGARGVNEARRVRARRARAANDRAASDGHGGGTAGERRRSRNYERARAAGRRASGRERAREEPDTLARREAARVLGVDADAEPAAVRSAYRERVKEVHPDTEGGDAEAFQQVNDAYERLQEE
jgi:hypothetical protein